MSRGNFKDRTPEELSEIGRKGGKAAHAKGTAHKFTHEEAVAAGKKGAAIRNARRKKAAEDAA